MPFETGAPDRAALLHRDHADDGSGGDDPLAVRLAAGTEQGRAPPGRRARRPKFKKIGVLGAGFMGAGIAYVTAKAGIPVVLLDRDMESAEKGKAHSDGLISEAGQEGPRQAGGEGQAAVADHADRRLRRPRRLRPRHRGGVRGFRGQEGGDRKGRGACSTSSAIFASNTSTIPITSLAKNSARPKNFIGIHFFSPVDRMMLVEIILGKKTGDKALATAHRLCPRDQEDADRRQRHARLLRQPLRAALHVGSLPDADRGRAGGDDRECRAHGRHAGRPAGADRRDGDRPRPEDHASRPSAISARRPSTRRRWR